MSTIIGIQVDKGAQNKGAADKGLTARGVALAEGLITFLKSEERGKLKRVLVDIVELDQQGRKAFRLRLLAERKAINAHVKAAEGTDDHAMMKKAANVAGARMSESMSFAKAVDAGYYPELVKSKDGTSDFPGVGYSACIALARTYLESQSAAGPTVKAGRKATPVLDKVKAYLEKLEKDGILKLDQWHDVDKLVHTMVKVRDAAKDMAPQEKAKRVISMPAAHAPGVAHGTLAQEVALQPAKPSQFFNAARVVMRRKTSRAANESQERAAATT